MVDVTKYEICSACGGCGSAGMPRHGWGLCKKCNGTGLIEVRIIRGNFHTKIVKDREREQE